MRCEGHARDITSACVTSAGCHRGRLPACRTVRSPAARSLTAACSIFVDELARWQKQKSTERGTPGGETGSVTFVQRFDSTLGSFVHFHLVALDGVFTRKDGPEVVFHEGPAPSRDDIAAVAARVEKRMMRWLRRSKLVDDRLCGA
ncbi:hypothetical protein [Sorangium sp. So ce887]|uniref:hypothetical protein n=1 Tax=Sorangium sp. So ce887 TaxID=3133324 RepID=UPI003F608353